MEYSQPVWAFCTRAENVSSRYFPPSTAEIARASRPIPFKLPIMAFKL